MMMSYQLKLLHTCTSILTHCNLTTALCRITNPVQTQWVRSSLRHNNPRSLSPLPHTCSPSTMCNARRTYPSWKLST
ncbi:uncharacterized protein B0J16DRAFT_334963 [Fusarium flagelliforme]|uniref:uncharacterized protein n=1 Tax=Fusarium flagelliforme TaxID=2675880 RepID=UPI001E8D6BD2|nr:uncharacterized protein B0J16DRAFT_334963 [Fusarium flagelliforme]KAH7193328.1 hypothetical protein B0J16DRAFT_334963 [Fusarium flagelliforme]